MCAHPTLSSLVIQMFQNKICKYVCSKHSCFACSPPFSGSDPIKIYTMVLHGIDRVDFPKRIGKRPDDLIRRLCKYGEAHTFT